jgi:ABC-type dipeptide/oligopeptide/nickel transport system permease subunit
MTATAAPVPLRVRGRVGTRWLRSPTARFGLALCAFVLLLAFVGPLVAPHGSTEVIARAYAPASDDGLLLGSDYLGRDVLSRVMSGGRALIVLPLLATIVAYLIGGTLALTAAISRSRAGEVMMRSVDVLIVFPGLLLMLVLVTGLGESMTTLMAGIILLQFPPVARILYAAALELSGRGYVEAAIARGERTRYLIAREILPNVAGTVAADFGPRLIASVFLIAALAFLGFGAEAPAANWALMITENRSGIMINGLAVFAPVVAIALLTIGVSLVSDAVARSIGAADDEEIG